MSGQETGWGVLRGQVIVGFIAIIFFPCEGLEIPLIASVAVHPDHQGRGLSKLLYSKALGGLRMRGATRFFEATTSERIMSSRAGAGGKVVRMVLRGRL